MNKIILSVLAVSMLSGCAYLKPANDIAFAVLTFPECRTEWENYVPVPRQGAVAKEYALIDEAFTKLVTVSRTIPNVTWDEALKLIAATPDKKVELEKAFQKIVKETKAYREDAQYETDNEILVDCEKNIVKAWEALFSNTKSVELLEVIKIMAPYAKLLIL